MAPNSPRPLAMGHEDRTERTLLIEQAAEILGVSRRTIYYRIRDGQLQTIRTRCGSQRVTLGSIERLLALIRARSQTKVASRRAAAEERRRRRTQAREVADSVPPARDPPAAPLATAVSEPEALALQIQPFA